MTVNGISNFGFSKVGHGLLIQNRSNLLELAFLGETNVCLQIERKIRLFINGSGVDGSADANLQMTRLAEIGNDAPVSS